MWLSFTLWTHNSYICTGAVWTVYWVLSFPVNTCIMKDMNRVQWPSLAYLSSWSLNWVGSCFVNLCIMTKVNRFWWPSLAHLCSSSMTWIGWGNGLLFCELYKRWIRDWRPLLVLLKQPFLKNTVVCVQRQPCSRVTPWISCLPLRLAKLSIV